MICEDLQLHILKFIPDKFNILSKFHLVCKIYKHVLQDRLENTKKIYWDKVKKLIGKEETDKIKQEANYCGTLKLYSKNLNDDACKVLSFALAKMTGPRIWLYLYNNSNQR